MSGDISSFCKPSFMSNTGSSRGVYKRNGEVLAIPHPVPQGSWKLNEDMAMRQSAISTATDSYQDPLRKQKLVAYHPNAARNRNAVVFPNEAEPFKRFCQPRNETTFDFMSNGTQEPGYQRFRTSSQNFYAYDTKALSVGESNQGIVSDKTKTIHKGQFA